MSAKGGRGNSCRKREQVPEMGSEQSDERDKVWMSGGKRAAGCRKRG